MTFLAPRLRHVMLLSSDVRSSLAFWGPQGLGLAVVGAPTERWATLRLDGGFGGGGGEGKNDDADDDNDARRQSSLSSSSSSSNLPPPFPLLAIKHAEGAAQQTTGHSPFLAFEVGDLQAVVQRCLLAGGRLDGPIRHGVGVGKVGGNAGAVAAVVAPGGQMVSLFERSSG